MNMLMLKARSWLMPMKWLPPAALAALAAVAITAGKANAQRNFATACTGTYFIQEDNGGVNLWTLHRDGTLVNTSLGEQAFNFSTQHGSWEADGPLRSRAIQLDFHRAADGTFASVGRVDITIRGQNGSCEKIAGDASGRLFEDGEDFTRPETDTGTPFQFSYTGFHVDVVPAATQGASPGAVTE